MHLNLQTKEGEIKAHFTKKIRKKTKTKDKKRIEK
jgi:hypothetical protein